MSTTPGPKSPRFCEQISPKEYKKEADEYTKRELEKLFEYLAKNPKAQKRSKTLSRIPLEISKNASPKKLVQQHEALFHPTSNSNNNVDAKHTQENGNKPSEGISPELLDLKLLEVKYGVRKATTFERLFANIIDYSLFLTIWWLFTSHQQESALVFGLITLFYCVWQMTSGQTIGKKVIGIHVGLEPFGMRANIYTMTLREVTKAICMVLLGWNLDPFLYTCMGKFSYDMFNKTNVYRSLRNDTAK